MSKTVCLNCNVDMIISKVGVAVIEWAFSPESPCLIRWTDQLECPVCHARVSYGSGDPTYHHTPHFEEKLEEARNNPNGCHEVHERKPTAQPLGPDTQVYHIYTNHQSKP